MSKVYYDKRKKTSSLGDRKFFRSWSIQERLQFYYVHWLNELYLHFIACVVNSGRNVIYPTFLPYFYVHWETKQRKIILIILVFSSNLQITYSCAILSYMVSTFQKYYQSKGTCPLQLFKFMTIIASDFNHNGFNKHDQYLQKVNACYSNKLNSS